MRGHLLSFLFGAIAGMRSMTASATLASALTSADTRLPWRPADARLRRYATIAAFGEMAGDKMPFAPDRRIAPSFGLRLVLGAVGGGLLAPRPVRLLGGAASGVAGAVAGTLLGRFARGAQTRTRSDWVRALTEDAVAASLALLLLGALRRRRLPALARGDTSSRRLSATP